MINNNFKKFITKILPCLISFGILLYFCIQNNNFLVLINIFPKLKFVYLILAIFSIFLSWFFDCLMIKNLLPKFSKSISDYFKITMYGQFYGAITPFSSGSQASQVILLNSKKVETGKAISILSQKFFISQLCTIVISSLSIIFKSQEFKDKIPGFRFLTLAGLIIQCSGIILLILFFINKRRVMNFIHYILKIAKKIHIIKNPEKISENLENEMIFLMKNNFSVNFSPVIYFYGIMQNILFCFVSFFIAKSFGCPGFPILNFIAAQTFVTLLSIANPLPGSAGTAEGSFLLLYKNFFTVKNISPAMILFRFINYYFGMIAGFFIIIKRKNTK
ncbi:MAG: flippase-like domain-containing protein [Clostridia bacterium]|nr:flippase-like domain-containing protein [Clostridia bacterium]